MLELRVNSALDSGMPFTLTASDFDTKLPANVNDDELHDTLEELPSHPRDQSTDTSAQLLLHDCLSPRLEILRIMNGLGPDPSYEKVVSLSSSISKTCRDLPNLELHRSDTDASIFRQNLMKLLLHRFLLSLHQPFANRASMDRQFYYSRKMSLEAAMELLHPEPSTSFMQMVLLGGGIFKNRMLHSALSICAELFTDIEEAGRTPGLWSAGSRQRLIDGVRQAQQQARRRIELGDSNLRLHMTLSMTLARVNGPVDEHAVLMEMADSALTSLKTSYDLLQARLSTVEPGSSSDVVTDLADISPEQFDLDLDFNALLDDSVFGGDLTLSGAGW